jgi:hypothetical protein
MAQMRWIMMFTSWHRRAALSMKHAILDYRASDRTFADLKKLGSSIALMLALLAIVPVLFNEFVKIIAPTRRQKQRKRGDLTTHDAVAATAGAVSDALAPVPVVGRAAQGAEAFYRWRTYKYMPLDPVTGTLQQMMESGALVYDLIEQFITKERYKRTKRKGDLKYPHTLSRLISDTAKWSARALGLGLEGPLDLVDRVIATQDEPPEGWEQ